MNRSHALSNFPEPRQRRDHRAPSRLPDPMPRREWRPRRHPRTATGELPTSGAAQSSENSYLLRAQVNMSILGIRRERSACCSHSRRSTLSSVSKAENLTSPDFAVARGLEIVLKFAFFGEGGISRPFRLGVLALAQGV